MVTFVPHQMQANCKCKTTDRKTWLINERSVSSTISSIDIHGMLAISNRLQNQSQPNASVSLLFECREFWMSPKIHTKLQFIPNIKLSSAKCWERKHTHSKSSLSSSCEPTKLQTPRPKIYSRKNHTEKRERRRKLRACFAYMHEMKKLYTEWFVCRMHTKYQYHMDMKTGTYLSSK